MKKLLLFLGIIFGSLVMVSCEEKTPVAEEPKEIVTTIVQELSKIDIEIEETYTLQYIVKANPGMTVSSDDIEVVTVGENNLLTGIKAGETTITLKLNEKKQIVPIKVYEKGALSSSFSFDKERLAGKKAIAFGDSVTANGTIGGAPTYFNVFVNTFEMKKGKNYAIGGTTATYMYEGSNIYKEYATNSVAIDGVRVVKQAYDNNELASVDYVFIAYGHNDQYFQPPITVAGDDVYDVNSFDSCHSFKGSYRYMINTLKLANPNVRIIILGCTYSEYDKTITMRYGTKYNYSDYRQAISEIAEEFDLTYIDPWEFLKPFFDAYDTKAIYKDSVHLSAAGHKILGDYICDYR